MASARKRSSEGKGNATQGKRPDFPKHRSTCSQGSSLGRKGRHSLRNQVNVDEVPAIRVIGKKFPSEGCRACAIWPRDNVELHEGSYPIEFRASSPLLAAF